MKIIFTWLFTSFFILCFGQKTKRDLAKDFSSADRKDILASLKLKLEPDLKQKPKLVVNRLWTKNGFAYFVGNVKDENGKAIDFRKTAYKEEVKAGVFDGDGTNALLKKTGNKWKVLAFVIGPSDVPWGCWWKTYKAPKEIFDYAEEQCD